MSGSLGGLGGGGDCYAGYCFHNDPFPQGQCTWYAAGRRPDVVGWATGDAQDWPRQVKGHLPTGHTPVVGALAIWNGGDAHSDPGTGHVAYVVGTQGNQILVDDFNWSLAPDYAGLEFHQHLMPAADTYIYGGPAGQGPGSTGGGTTGGSNGSSTQPSNLFPNNPDTPNTTALGRWMAFGPDGGYTLDSWGGIHQFGGTPAVTTTGYWPGHDLARSIALAPNGTSGYELDAWGGIHQFGGAPAVTSTGYWPHQDLARDIAVRANGASGYELDAWGGIHPFGGAPAVQGTAYWPGSDLARSIALRSDGTSGYVLDAWGGIHPFGGAPALQAPAYWKNWDIARSIVLRTDTSGYVLDGFGGIHPFGGAVAVTPSYYTPNVDDARAIALSHGGGGYVVFNDGHVAPFGGAADFGSPWTNDPPGTPHPGGPQ